MKRVMMLLAWAGLALLLALTAAFAQQFKVKSKGTATATGNGDVQVMMISGTLTATVKGNFMIGPANVKLTIKGKQGKKTELKDKKDGKVEGYKYEGADCTLTANGEQYMVLLQKGTGIKLTANGAGQMSLSGTGTYSAVSGKTKKTGKWAPRSTPDYMVTPIPAKFGEIEVEKPAPPKKK
ncbi:MAG: hypothetical protein ACYDCO_12015 [Armatimonadota bacterium]